MSVCLSIYLLSIPVQSLWNSIVLDRRETNGTAGGNQITEKVCLSVYLSVLCLSLSLFLTVFSTFLKKHYSSFFTSPGSSMEEKRTCLSVSLFLCLSVSLSFSCLSLSTSVLTLLKLISSVGSSLAKGDQHLVYLSVFLSLCLSLSLSVSLSVSLSLCLSVSLSFCLSVFLSLCLSVSLSLRFSALSMFLFKLSFSFSGSSLAKGDQHLVEHKADWRAEGVRPHLRSQRLGKLLSFVNENFSL